MSTSFLPNVEDAFDHFIATAVTRGCDLYDLDGETAFRRTGRCIETFDYEALTTGGQP